MSILEYFTATNILQIILIVASAYIISKIFEFIFVKRIQKRKKERSVIIPLKRITSIMIYIIAFLSILYVLEVDITAAAAGLGITAIVVGFGLKDIISNWISGIIIISGSVYRIDDVIRVGNITGVVTDITLRTTRLKTYDRNEVIIPNSILVNEKIINLTAGRRELISSITFKVDYTCDTNKVKKIIADVLKKNQNVTFDNKRKREIRFIVRVKEWDIEIETLFWINRPRDEEFIKSKITEAVKKEFEKKKIIPPFRAPARTSRFKFKKQS
jgi:small-conductance mechanosensitive channel